ncbi:MAG: hypothetical protein HPY60_05705 [Candidatus Methanofastidiosum sp.]|nr:hypothetical protein [Methanofastidiosum sp.]
MGCSYNVICKKCGAEYRISSGGGFTFHKLHCDRCGMEKDIFFMELGDLHNGYLKGLKVPYCMATAKHDKFVQENYTGEVIYKEQYHREIEKYAGNCECGGKYKFNAPTRCPKCGAAESEPALDEGIIMYD